MSSAVRPSPGAVVPTAKALVGPTHTIITSVAKYTVTEPQLRRLPSNEARLRSLYRRFTRLRPFVSVRNDQRGAYQRYVKSKFWPAKRLPQQGEREPGPEAGLSANVDPMQLFEDAAVLVEPSKAKLKTKVKTKTAKAAKTATKTGNSEEVTVSLNTLYFLQNLVLDNEEYARFGALLINNILVDAYARERMNVSLKLAETPVGQKVASDRFGRMMAMFNTSYGTNL